MLITLDIIKENISWVKDIITLLFTATATVIGVLTYKRAKRTLLQPIRTEVIKRQSDLLSRLLQFLKENDNSFEKGIDYINIVQVNVLSTLKDYGFVFQGQEDIEKTLNQAVVSWIPCGNSKTLYDVEVIGTFELQQKQSIEIDHDKKNYENLKNGIIDIEKIYNTQTFSDFMTKLLEFKNDPFMPKIIQKILIDLIDSIYYNLTVILKKELENFMLTFSAEYFTKGKAPKFNSIGVYNEFNHARQHHKLSILHLREEMRKYLLVDEAW